MNVGMATVQDYVVDCLRNSDCDPGDWDVFDMVFGLVGWMGGAGVDLFDGVPAGVFAELLEGYVW